MLSLEPFLNLINNIIFKIESINESDSNEAFMTALAQIRDKLLTGDNAITQYDEVIQALYSVLIEKWRSIRQSSLRSPTVMASSYFTGDAQLEECIENILTQDLALDISSELKSALPEDILMATYEEVFSYSKLIILRNNPHDGIIDYQLQNGEYYVFKTPETNHWVNLQRDSFTKQDTDINKNINLQVGWKIHISIDDTDQQNIIKAWNVIRNFVIKHHIWIAKFRAPHMDPWREYPTEEGNYAGKQGVIYISSEPPGLAEDNPERWKNLMKELEEALLAADIKPDINMPAYNLKIPGATYISYGSDRGADGKYEKDNTKRKHENDPFKDFSLNVNHKGLDKHA